MGKKKDFVTVSISGISVDIHGDSEHIKKFKEKLLEKESDKEE